MADLLAPQPWALDETGAILGHLLTVDDATFLAAVEDGRLDGLALEEAFGQLWADLGQRAIWTRLYAEVLRGHADHAERQLEAQRRKEALQKVAEQTQIRGRE